MSLPSSAAAMEQPLQLGRTLVPSGAETAASPADGAVREMGHEELRVFLARNNWGVLSTIHDGRPYAVPVSYGFDGTCFYLASGPGRKLCALEASPAVCLTVTEVRDGEHWGSVVAMGNAIPLRDVPGRLRGLRSIGRQRNSGLLPASAKDLARAAGATVFRITPTELSGRARR